MPNGNTHRWIAALAVGLGSFMKEAHEDEITLNPFLNASIAACDQFNYLYDSDCNIICAPDGGFIGTGDGKCPDFIEPIKKTLIWEDLRK